MSPASCVGEEPYEQFVDTETLVTDITIIQAFFLQTEINVNTVSVEQLSPNCDLSCCSTIIINVQNTVKRGVFSVSS